MLSLNIPSSSLGQNVRTARVTTGSITGGATSLVTITWTTPFADENYTASVNVLDPTTALLSLNIVHIESITASAITVRVSNTSVGSLTGTIHAIAIKD